MARGHLVADGTPADIKLRVGEKRVRFKFLGGDKSSLRRLYGVQHIEWYEDHATLFTKDADSTVRALAASGLGWSDIEVTGADLEEAFVTLTEAKP